MTNPTDRIESVPFPGSPDQRKEIHFNIFKEAISRAQSINELISAIHTLYDQEEVVTGSGGEYTREHMIGLLYYGYINHVTNKHDLRTRYTEILAGNVAKLNAATLEQVCSDVGTWLDTSADKSREGLHRYIEGIIARPETGEMTPYYVCMNAALFIAEQQERQGQMVPNTITDAYQLILRRV